MSVRVLAVPNTFRDGPDAAAVALALTRGAHAAGGAVEVEAIPLADGGDGTLETLARLWNADVQPVEVTGPLGEPVTGRIALTSNGAAGIEMADAAGVRLLPPAVRDPFRSSTWGVGELIRAALDTRPRRILLGAGGSGTIDVGAGALAALGARFLGPRGEKLAASPEGLEAATYVDTRRLDARLARVPILVLADVRTPLRENLRLYGAQKGVRLESAARFQAIVERVGSLASSVGADVLSTPWLGAGGGLAGGLRALAGADVVSGATYLMRLARLPARLKRADLVLTGEGRLDATSAEGKLPLAIARLAARYGVPTVVVAGTAAGVPPLPALTRYVTLEPEVDVLAAIADAARRIVLDQAALVAH